MPGCLEKFKDDDERGGENRQRWAGQTTFVLAAVGSAIGLGNFWRFPYLCYKWGGALFFIPYLGCLFFLGIPLLMLEFSLGQKLQRGDIGVFRGIHPKLYGVGLASVFTAYAITFYYNVIIAWSLVYFFAAWKNPLPWSVLNTTDDAQHHKDCQSLYITEEYFYRDLLHTYDDDCVQFDTVNFISGNEHQGSQFQWQVFLAALAVWFIVYWCVFKGVKSSSYVVWVTVPLPVFFIFIMVMKGLTLPNAHEGIRMYLMGEIAGVPADIGEKLSQSSMWSDACAQIFFSIGVCMGVMTSYSSYNPVDKPIIGDAFRVAGYNSLLSFFAGFAVFSTVGYLIGIDSPVQAKTSSSGLAFIAYPAAIELMPVPNLFTILLALTLFTLGIDSAFSLVEATSTVIYDTPSGRAIPRKCTALILCVTGALFSIIFCFNWGFTYFDVVDHYLAVYLMLLLGIFQCFGAGWIWGFDEAIKQSNKAAVYINFIGYWVPHVLLGILAYHAFPDSSWVSMPIFWIIQVIQWIIGFCVSGLKFCDWYDFVFLSGVRALARSMTKLSKKSEDVFPWWEDVFEFWWGFSIKYFIPWAIWWLLMLQLQADITADPQTGNGYGSYHMFWQVMGFLYPILGLVFFFLPMFMNCGEDKFDHNVDEALSFKEKPGRRTGASSSVKPAADKAELEMGALKGETKE